jgi:hypothetical protein
MEIQGKVHNHHGAASYKFSRTMQSLTLCRSATGWRKLLYLPPGTPDDTDPFGNEGHDEDDFPEEGNIYVVDRPTLPSVHGSQSKDVEAVKFLNFIERLDVVMHYGTYHMPAPPQFFPWCTCLWVGRQTGSSPWTLIEKKSGNRAGLIDLSMFLAIIESNEREAKRAHHGGVIIPLDPNGLF